MIRNPQEFGLNQQLTERKPSLIPILLFQLILSTKVIVSYVYVLNASYIQNSTIPDKHL